MEKRSVFKELESANVCYAVGVAFMSLESNKFDYGSKDYYIMVHSDDVKKLSGFTFLKNDSEGVHIFEMSLSNDDLLEFKSLQEKFKKVHSGDSGRVYELKTNSFKEYYELKTK
jgi:hypothetical protein